MALTEDSARDGSDSTRRFSTRVDDYVKYRPSYPDALIDLFVDAVGLARADVVADVGSGTGKLSDLFLRKGNRVFAVEPNDEMRETGERLLGAHPGFVSVAGTAEATTLDDHSVQLVIAGQAFHWFDPVATRAEFRRILEPERSVVLVWNDRRHETAGFMAGYESLLVQHGTDYHRVNHQNLSADEIGRFFGPEGCRVDELPNRQSLDLDGLQGRLFSSSYIPGERDRGHRAVIEAARRLFDRHQVAGRVTLEYVTRVYSGRLSG